VLRVVVLSKQPMLVLNALRSKLPGCRPVAVATVDDVIEHVTPGAVVLLDLGEGDRGVDAARTLREHDVDHGIVVVGDAVAGDLQGVVVLPRPFQLGDLVRAFTQVHKGGAGSPYLAVASDTTAPARKRAATPESGWEGARASDAGSAAPPPATSTPPPTPAPASAEPPTRPPQAPDQDAPRGEPESLWGQQAPPGAVRREQSRSVPEVARPAVTAADPQLLEGEPPSHPGAAAAGHGGSSLRGSLGRWRKRKGAATRERAADVSGEGELYQRLVRVFEATSQVRVIIDEFPMVTRRAALYQAVVAAVAEEFQADTVGLWRKRGNGWIVAGHHGFTQREARFPASTDQPLLREIEDTAGAILLDPTSGFQALINGVGGAHTESFMAACVAAGSHRLGILTVGRDRQLVEEELDRLVEMAVEAAVGIGVADHIHDMAALLDRARDRAGVDDVLPGELRESLLEEVSAAWQPLAESPGTGDAGTDSSDDAGTAGAGDEQGEDRSASADRDTNAGAAAGPVAPGEDVDEAQQRRQPRPTTGEPGLVIDLLGDVRQSR